MTKEELIKRYGEDYYNGLLKKNRGYYKEHKEEINARLRKYYIDNRESILKRIYGNRKKSDNQG